MTCPRPKPHLFWIYALLALGGYFNAAAILIHARTASHHTGNISNVALALGRGDWRTVGALLGIIGCFALGSFIAGLLFHDRSFESKHRYGLTLIVMGLILLATMFAGPAGIHLLYLGAVMMGLQNGLFIFYKNMLARSTHITGTLTDFAFALGSLLRVGPDRRPEERTRVLYHGCAILTFLLGGFLAPLVLKLGIRAFWLVLAIGYILLGLYYFLLRASHHLDGEKI